MKIAIIQPRSPYHIAGSEKISLKQAEMLALQGHEVHYYTSKIPSTVEESFLFQDFRSRSIANLYIKYFDISSAVPNLHNEKPDNEHTRWVTEALAFNQEILPELESNKPDVIFTYYLPDSIFKPKGIPNVVYLSGYPKDRIPFYKSFIEFVTTPISISHNVADKWAPETKGKSKQFVLGTGVEIPTDTNTPILKKGEIDLVFAGRLIERKGVLTLIEALKNSKNLNKIHLWILGDGEMMDLIKSQIERLGLDKNVTVTGNVPNPYDYFKMSDICVYPSHHGDGLMGTVLESMACGKPVITTTDNGNEDVIKNGVDGVLIEPRNTVKLTDVIDMLCEDPEQRIRLGENARARIIKDFSWEKHTEKLSEILSQIVSENRELKKERKLPRQN